MDPIPVRAHGVIGLAHLVIALGFLAGGAYSEDYLLGVIGALNLGLAYSWSVIPIFTLGHNRVDSYNRFGKLRRQTFVKSLDQLEIRGRQLFLGDARLPVVDGTLARARDWDAAADAIDTARQRAAARQQRTNGGG